MANKNNTQMAFTLLLVFSCSCPLELSAFRAAPPSATIRDHGAFARRWSRGTMTRQQRNKGRGTASSARLGLPTTPSSRTAIPRINAEGGMPTSMGGNRSFGNDTTTATTMHSTTSSDTLTSIISGGASTSTVLPLLSTVEAQADDLGRAIFLEHSVENAAATKALLAQEQGERHALQADVLHRNDDLSSTNDGFDSRCHPRSKFDSESEDIGGTGSTANSRNSRGGPSPPTALAVDAGAIIPEQQVDAVTAVLELSREAVDDATPPVAPTVRKILQFAVPAVGVWLCNPLLSMIDTAAVGLFAGTVQQAALNPAVAVTDYTALLIAFLYTGTTNLVASAWEQDKHKTSDRTAETLLGVMRLSLYVGAGLGAVLFLGAPALVRTMIGGDAVARASPAVFRAAIDYVRIRALGMPAAAFIGSTQAACLGMQDIKSPLYVLAAAALVNFCCDMVTVHTMGAAGVAWATVASQFAGMGLFIHWLQNKRPVVNVSKAILDMNTDTLSNALQNVKSNKKNRSFSVRGFLHGKLRLRDLVKPPNRKTLDLFSEYLVPVTATQVGRVSGYVAMSHVVSSSLGTASMAAQQIIVSLFYCLTPIGDSLSLTAQSFVPAIFEKKPSPQRAVALRQTIANFAKAGCIFGALMVAAIGCIPVVSRGFTSDRSVSGLVNTVTPLLAAIVSVHGLVCAAEGLLLGQKDLGYLGKLYGAFFAVVPFFMLRLKTMTTANLTAVWTVFLGYQLTRCVVWSTRVALLQRKTQERAAAV